MLMKFDNEKEEFFPMAHTINDSDDTVSDLWHNKNRQTGRALYYFAVPAFRDIQLCSSTYTLLLIKYSIYGIYTDKTRESKFSARETTSKIKRKMEYYMIIFTF